MKLSSLNTLAPSLWVSVLLCVPLMACDGADSPERATAPVEPDKPAPPTDEPAPPADKPATNEPAPPAPDEPAPPAPDEPALPVTGNADADLDALISKVASAARTKDFKALKALMEEEFFAVGPTDEEGENTRTFALAHWRRNPTQLDKLVTFLSGSCGMTSESEWLCPKALLDLEERGDAEYVLLGQTDGVWGWNAFVSDPEIAPPRTAGGSGGSGPRRQRAAARREIKRGRKLSAKKDLAGALEAFERALELDPESATASCEAGYAALRQHKLDYAQKRLKHGLGHAQTPNKEAACRFNLGMVQEKRGDTVRALRQYKRSLELRDSKTVRSRISKLSPSGGCLPPHRIIDRTKENCGLSEDYWECGVDEGGAPIDDEFFAGNDSKPLSPGRTLRVATAMFGELRMRSDLVLDDGGALSLLAELGWTVRTGDEETVDDIQFTYADLVPGGTQEVVVVVKTTQDGTMSDAVWFACEDKHTDEAAIEACVQATGSPSHATTYFGCGALAGRWVCGRSDVEPKTEKEFMALFACK